MREAALPYEVLVLVCANRRPPGERTSCAGEGRCGAALRDALKEGVAKRGLKTRVRVSSSGCLDVCREGPNVVVVGPNGKKIWYKEVAETDVPAILDQLPE